MPAPPSSTIASAHPRRAGARWSFALPLLASVAAHAALVAAAFFVVWTAARVPGPPPGPPAAISFLDPSLNQAERSLPKPQDAPRADQRSLLADVPPARTTIETPPLDDLLARVAEAAPEAALATPSTDLSDLMHERLLPEVRFFGLGAESVERIVYVVDASGSTISLFPLLRNELLRSLRRLAPAQQFQVIFFQGDPNTGTPVATSCPHPAQPYRTKETRLIRATRSNMGAVTEWVEDVRPRGLSNPLPAIEVALALDPDAVFLLSGPIHGAGNWDIDPNRALARLDELNPIDRRSGYRPVTIKAIEFLEQDPSGILRAIGRLHGGADGHTLLTREQLTSR